MLRYKNVLITLAIIAVLIFGGFFAFNARAFVVYRQDMQTARETSGQTLRIFENWLTNESPPVAVTHVYPPTDAPTSPGAVAVTFPPSDSAVDELQEPGGFDQQGMDKEYELPCFQVLMQTLRDETGNDDIIAFINISGTNIQYVVVQGRNNVFYMDRDLFGQRNRAGSIFMDYRNRADFNDPNTIIYGHNLHSEIKFTQLHLFRQRDFFHDNRYIQIFTDIGLIEYEIFSVFTTHVSFNYIQVQFSGNEFGQLINEIMRRRYYNVDVPVTANDRILILSTCTSVNDDERLVIVGRRMDE